LITALLITALLLVWYLHSAWRYPKGTQSLDCARDDIVVVEASS